MANNSMQSLTETLKSQLKEQSDLMNMSVHTLQSEHEQALKKLFSQGLDSMKVRLQSMQEELEKNIKAMNSGCLKQLEMSNLEVGTQLMSTSKMISRSTQDTEKLMLTAQENTLDIAKRAMKLSLVPVILLSLLIMLSATAWSYYRLSQVNSLELVELSQKIAAKKVELQQHQDRLDQLSRDFCKTPAGKKYCVTFK